MTGKGNPLPPGFINNGKIQVSRKRVLYFDKIYTTSFQGNYCLPCFGFIIDGNKEWHSKGKRTLHNRACNYHMRSNDCAPIYLSTKSKNLIERTSHVTNTGNSVRDQAGKILLAILISP